MNFDSFFQQFRIFGVKFESQAEYAIKLKTFQVEKENGEPNLWKVVV